MTAEQIATLLIEQLPQQLDFALGGDPTHGAMVRKASGSKQGEEDKEKIKVLFNRMLLQAHSVPSLQAYLQGASIEKDPDNPRGVRIQLDFLKLPKEVIPDLERLLSVDWFKNHRLVRFTKNGSARTGLEVSVEPKDIPGDTYDYAY